MEYYIDEKSGKAEGTSRKASWNQKEQRNSLDREDKNSITEKKSLLQDIAAPRQIFKILVSQDHAE